EEGWKREKGGPACFRLIVTCRRFINKKWAPARRPFLWLVVSPGIAQAGCNSVDRQVDATPDALVHLAVAGDGGAMALEQLYLQVVQRIEIGETILDRARQQRIGRQAFAMTGNRRQH